MSTSRPAFSSATRCWATSYCAECRNVVCIHCVASIYQHISLLPPHPLNCRPNWAPGVATACAPASAATSTRRQSAAGTAPAGPSCRARQPPAGGPPSPLRRAARRARYLRLSWRSVGSNVNGSVADHDGDAHRISAIPCIACSIFCKCRCRNKPTLHVVPRMRPHHPANCCCVRLEASVCAREHLFAESGHVLCGDAVRYAGFQTSGQRHESPQDRDRGSVSEAQSCQRLCGVHAASWSRDDVCMFGNCSRAEADMLWIIC